MEAELRVEVGIRKGMDARTPTVVNLRVEDAASGETLADIEFDANDWLNVSTGLISTHKGHIGNHLERVGRKMVVRQESVPRDVVTSYKRDEGQEQAMSWALLQGQVGETVEVRSTNSGWKAIYRSWPEAS